jgi:hypothetical protein
VVLATVDLSLPARSRRGGDGHLEVREAGQYRLDQRSLPGPGRAGDDDDPAARNRDSTGRGYRSRSSSSSLRCRSDRPPIVFP